MAESPLISIITVTFNAAGHLVPTMKSVAEQTFNDFEHLIVDGASTDNTLEVAREFASPNLVLYSKKDEGIYHGMNRGLKLAKGKYILFLNAGDSFASSETLAAYARAAEKGAEIIYGDTVIVDSDRNILRPRHLYAPRILTTKSFLKGMLICHQAFMVKKEIAPFYDRLYRFSADYDWTIRCIEASRPGKRENLDCIAIHYLDNGATEQNKLTSLRERFAIMKRHYGFFPTFLHHLSFIPRAMRRNLRSNPG